MATTKPRLRLLYGVPCSGNSLLQLTFAVQNRERVPAKGYISDQLTDEAIGVVDRAKALDQPFMLYLAYNAPHLPNDNPAPEQYQKQFNTGSQTADNYYASVLLRRSRCKTDSRTVEEKWSVRQHHYSLYV